MCFLLCLQNFSVLLTRHNPQTDSNAHFIVQPKMGSKSHIVQPAAQRRVRAPHRQSWQRQYESAFFGGNSYFQGRTFITLTLYSSAYFTAMTPSYTCWWYS